MMFVIRDIEDRTEDIMKKLMKKLEDIMVAVTFAEAGEYDEARRQEGGTENEELAPSLDEFKRTALENAKK
jgi:hypothetical protein